MSSDAISYVCGRFRYGMMSGDRKNPIENAWNSSSFKGLTKDVISRRDQTYALQTGIRNNVTVVDVDAHCKNGKLSGVEWFKSRPELFSELERTFSVRTKGGG